MEATRAVRLKVTLEGCEPPVWRRLLVAETMALGDLHMAVQAAMGWENSHLHLFEVGRKAQYGDPSMLDDVEDEAGVTVGGLAARPVKRIGYRYDMGDDWGHTIAIEGFEPLDPARAYPACIDGRGPARRRIRAGRSASRRCWRRWRTGARDAQGLQRVAGGVRSGGFLGGGGGGAGAAVVQAEAAAEAAGGVRGGWRAPTLRRTRAGRVRKKIASVQKGSATRKAT